MARLGKTPARRQRDLSAGHQLAETPAPRIAAVSDLIRQRRRIALCYRRSRSEAELHQLRDIDHQLAAYNIDIPAIEHRVAQRKG
jgi:predicted DNA-binding transcriptional regulator YafY